MEDAKIVELYWQRSGNAIQETDKKYGAYCHTVAANILNNAQDAEECVNDTYMGAWNAMPDKRPERLSPFLGKIARRFAVSKLREKTRTKRGGGEAALVLDELSEYIPTCQDPERQIELQELTAAVNDFLSRLSETERGVFLARYWFMAPEKEIAEHFSFSRSKVSSMLRRTRLKLCSYLEEAGLC